MDVQTIRQMIRQESPSRIMDGTVISSDPRGTRTATVRETGGHVHSRVYTCTEDLGVGDRVIVARLEGLDRLVVLGKIASSQGSSLSNKGVLAPPANFGVLAYPAMVYAQWDTYPGEDLSWEIQYSFTGSPYADAAQVLVSRGSYYLYPCDPGTTVYMRARAIRWLGDNNLQYSAWSGWASTSAADYEVPNLIITLTNKSGGARIATEVVIVGAATDNSFDTTTAAGDTGVTGVVMEGIADNADGLVCISGYCQILIDNAVTRGDYLQSSATEGRADGVAARSAGSFARALESGVQDDAIWAIISLGMAAGGGHTPAPLNEGEALVANAVPAWVATTEPTWLGTHTWGSGLALMPTDATGQALGDATHRWDLHTQDVFFEGATGDNSITIPDGLADALNIVDTGANVFLQLNTDDDYFLIDPGAVGIKVGIGCVPGYALEVNGDIALQDGETLAFRQITGIGTYSIHYAAVAPRYPLRFVGNNDSGTQRYFEFGYYTDNDQAQAWNPGVVINSYNGNVGIGIAAPDRELHVIGQTILGAECSSYNWAPAVGDDQLWLTTNTAPTTNVGSVLVLSGRYRTADTGQIAFGAIAGLKENATDPNGAGFMAFYTSTAAAISEKMRITSAGDVGIGTLIPGTDLEIVRAAVSSIQAITSYSDTDAHYPGLFFRKSHHDTPGTLAATTDSDVLGIIRFYGVDTGPGFAFGARMVVTQKGAAAASFVEADLKLYTYSTTGANTNQLYLDGGTGNVGIGCVPTAPFQVGTNRPILIDSGAGKVEIRGAAGGWATCHGFQGSAGTVKGGLWALGSADGLTHWNIGPAYNDGMFTVLAASGRVGIGTVAPLAKCHIDQAAVGGAIPVLTLDQADVSEEFMKFIGTAAGGNVTQSIVAPGDITTANPGGYLRVYITDIGNQITDKAYYIRVHTIT